MSYYVGFSIICEGIATFNNEQDMKAWLNHATDIDRYLDKDAAKYDSGKHWDSCLGERKQFTLEQVNEMFGGSLENALYAQSEPATGEKTLWYYF